MVRLIVHNLDEVQVLQKAKLFPLQDVPLPGVGAAQAGGTEDEKGSASRRCSRVLHSRGGCSLAAKLYVVIMQCGHLVSC